VEHNLEEGLWEAGKWRHIQSLDYVNIPFRCSLYHVYGYIKSDCSVRVNFDLGSPNWENTVSSPYLGTVLPPKPSNVIGSKVVWNVELITPQPFLMKESPTSKETLVAENYINKVTPEVFLDSPFNKIEDWKKKAFLLIIL
jgi:hypothetical protein